ncbi:UPF0193 protein EVG1-like protein [Operophtera brumata]|uniref:UPF0193 protein EVG1-like protein n=1 Tax=Operophtera brumata TaxID=104452 RepID=A0A0L7KZI5_OPEBR|nr:UPF0193 protein EVG1-like protein [Operophtera brumata]
MEAPDASGFVNITWPSKNVPHGVLVEESRLDIKLRHESGYGLRRAERSPPPPPAQAQTTTAMAYGECPEQAIPAPMAGDAHRETINQQIAERMRALDCLGIDSQCSSARSGDAHRDTISQQITERMRAFDCLGIDSQCSSARSVGRRASQDHQPADS